jgi:hypothetical protein
MDMRLYSMLLVTAATLALAGSASAQTREGFFIGIGTGVAWGEANGTGMANSNGASTWVMPIRLGWKLNDRMLLGAETGVWGDSHQDRALGTGYYGAALYYYPAAKGVFLKGGLGLATAHFSGVGLESVSGHGLGGVIGAGYDIPIGRRIAITPMATFRFGGPGTLTPEDGSGDAVQGFKHNVVEIGVGFSFY